MAYLLLFISGLLSLPVFAESETPAMAHKWNLVVGYYRETLSHPGLGIGLSYPLLQNEYHALLLETNLGVFLPTCFLVCGIYM